MKLCPKCGKEKPKTEFYKNNQRPDGLTYACKVCLIDGMMESNRRNRERKKMIINESKTPCVKCGESRVHILDWHHINPSQKSFDLSKEQEHGIVAIKAEIEKCVCLCRNCHADFHYIYGNVPELPLESLSEYLGCDPYSLIPNVVKENVL